MYLWRFPSVGGAEAIGQLALLLVALAGPVLDGHLLGLVNGDGAAAGLALVCALLLDVVPVEGSRAEDAVERVAGALHADGEGDQNII